MPDYQATPLTSISVNVDLPNPTAIRIFEFPLSNSVPLGALRIGGDSPNGLILHGVAPVQRTIDIFDTATNVHAGRTTSSPLDGTYEFSNLADRNYFVICRGLLGERDQIWSNVSPV